MKISQRLQLAQLPKKAQLRVLELMLERKQSAKPLDNLKVAEQPLQTEMVKK